MEPGKAGRLENPPLSRNVVAALDKEKAIACVMSVAPGAKQPVDAEPGNIILTED